MTVHYPVNLDLNGRACLVVGGGSVAARKVASLVAAGADVTVVAPRVDAAISALTSVTIVRRAYRRGETANYRLVITATDDPAVNQAVYDDAEAAGVWVNSADDPQRCSFTLPAVVRRGSVLLTASTGAASPALSAWLRGRLEQEFGPELADLAAALAVHRARIHAAGASTEGVDWASIIEAEMAS
jgi:precorrin-2 dehydrogenase/sirohydrochlorin ferrochelatase